jgi:hypothetical protein
MEVVRCSEMLVSCYITTLCHNPEIMTWIVTGVKTLNLTVYYLIYNTVLASF